MLFRLATHTRTHTPIYFLDTAGFKVSHYTLDLCRVSSLLDNPALINLYSKMSLGLPLLLPSAGRSDNVGG